MQKRESWESKLCIEASLLTQTRTDGGDMDSEVTEIAVIACFSTVDLAEMTYTVEATHLIAAIKSAFKL